MEEKAGNGNLTESLLLLASYFTDVNVIEFQSVFGVHLPIFKGGCSRCGQIRGRNLCKNVKCQKDVTIWIPWFGLHYQVEMRGKDEEYIANIYDFDEPEYVSGLPRIRLCKYRQTPLNKYKVTKTVINIFSNQRHRFGDS